MRTFVAAVVAVVAVAVLVGARSAAADNRPVVIWHGMGDTCCNPFSMGMVQKKIEKTLPGIYVKSIEIGTSTGEDEIAGFFGNVNTQLETVCEQLKQDPKLANGFNALGFSQGGQFLRAYVERCNSPPVYNLITFGGQHMGVAEIPHCEWTNSTLCELMAEALGVGAYVDGIRELSVQAQYFRSSYDYQKYLEKNIFLADINNENEQKNATYKKNLISLNKLVLIQFTEDTMVIPRASEYFGSFKNGAMAEVIPMRQHPIYTEDWIGLKELDSNNKIVEMACHGDHMQFTMEYLVDNVVKVFLDN